MVGVARGSACRSAAADRLGPPARKTLRTSERNRKEVGAITAGVATFLGPSHKPEGKRQTTGHSPVATEFLHHFSVGRQQ
jgi:hypothetical protein